MTSSSRASFSLVDLQQRQKCCRSAFSWIVKGLNYSYASVCLAWWRNVRLKAGAALPNSGLILFPVSIERESGDDVSWVKLWGCRLVTLNKLNIGLIHRRRFKLFLFSSTNDVILLLTAFLISLRASHARKIVVIKILPCHGLPFEPKTLFY